MPIINISKSTEENRAFCENYIGKYGGGKYQYPVENQRVISFDSESMKGNHDNKDFNIDMESFNWPHLIICERYLEKNQKGGRRRSSKKRPTARRRRSSKARKSRKSRATRRR